MAAVQAAVSQLGVPYVFGGEEPGVGFDCSGLVQWAWGQAGVSIPRTTETQWPALPHVPLDALEPGDLLFYYNLDNDNQVDHVVMYTGSGPYGTDTVIQAPFTGSTVSYSPIFTEGADRGGSTLTPAAGARRRVGADPSGRYDDLVASGRPVVGEKNRTTAIVPIACQHRGRRGARGPPPLRRRRVGSLRADARRRPHAVRAHLLAVVPRRVGRAREDPHRGWRAPRRQPRRGHPLRRARHHARDRERARAARLRPGRLLLPHRARSSAPCGPAPVACPPAPPTPTAC